MRIFGNYFKSDLIVHPCLDEIRTLSPNRLVEQKVQCDLQVFTELVLPFSHQPLFAKLR